MKNFNNMKTKLLAALVAIVALQLHAEITVGTEWWDVPPKTTLLEVGDALYNGTNFVEAVKTNIMPYAQAALQASKEYTDDSTNAVVKHVDAMDTSYYRFQNITNVNQSVQYVEITDPSTTELQIRMPETGMTKDWLVYVYAVTNVNIILPGPADYWCSSYDVTNAIPAGVPTALYFSQITDGVFSLGRKKLDCPITISSPLTARLRQAQALSRRRPRLAAPVVKTAAKPTAAAKAPATAKTSAATNTAASVGVKK